MSNSTADRFCRVFAKLQAIDPGLEVPMRHQMRAIRDAAIRLIDSALAEAENLAWAANDLPDACNVAIDEATRTAAQSSTDQQG